MRLEILEVMPHVETCTLVERRLSADHHPFDAAGNVAYDALVANLERWNGYDLAGYVVLGSNGEAPS